MDLNLFDSRNLSISSRVTNSFVRSFMREIQEHLNNQHIRNGKFAIDRFVDDFAVLENQENGKFIDVPINKMPKDAEEGVFLRFENNNFTVDWEATEKARIEARTVMERITRIPIFAIDRFEGDNVVLKNQNAPIIRNIPKSLLPEGAVVGDVLRFENNIYSIDNDNMRELQTDKLYLLL